MRHLLIAIASLIVTIARLNAAPISYTLSGMLSGTLGNTSLTNVPFAFLVNADTNSIYRIPPPADPAISTLITIGTATGTFTEATIVYFAANPVFGIVGIADANFAHGEVTLGSPQLVNYILGSPVIVASPTAFVFAANGTLATSLGQLTITGAQNLTLVAALQSPEPATAIVAAIGLLAIVALRRKAGIRLRHPKANEREVFLRAVASRISRELMIRAYGWDPAMHE